LLFFLSSINYLLHDTELEGEDNEVRLYLQAQTHLTSIVPTCPRGDIEEHKKKVKARKGKDIDDVAQINCVTLILRYLFEHRNILLVQGNKLGSLRLKPSYVWS
jgi:hypothetical protein